MLGVLEGVAVLDVRDALASGAFVAPEWPCVDPARKLVLVTSHQRENFADGFRSAMRALAVLAERSDVQLVYPARGRSDYGAPLARRKNVVLLERSHLIITDSGGVQEEAPSLGKPVLVLREKTERPEAVEAGTVKLVGTSEERILDAATRLLDDPQAYTATGRRARPSRRRSQRGTPRRGTAID